MLGSVTPLRFALEPIHSAADVAPLWQGLAARAPHSFFQSWDWIGSWLECLPSERQPRLLIGRRGGEVAALAVVTAARRRLFRCWPIATAHLNDSGLPEEAILTIEHNGVLLDPALRGDSITGALEWLVRAAGVGELHLPGMPVCYAQAAAAAAGVMSRVLLQVDHYVDLVDLRRRGLSHGEALSANTRQQIKRSIKAAGGQGLRLRRAGSVGEALDWLDRLALLHQVYWTGRGKPGAFANPFFLRFHRLLIERAFDRGGIDLWRVNGAAGDLGYLYNFVQDGVISAYQSGLAYGTQPRLRPGAVCHALAITRAEERGAVRYDFLAGDSQFKRSFATHAEDLAWIVLSRRSLAARLEQWARRSKNRLKHIVKRK